MIYHAGRQLSGKGLRKPFSFFQKKKNPWEKEKISNGLLRYLKTVRVTAGLYQGLARLEPGLTHWQWPRFTEYTNPFGLALGYVFIKQSESSRLQPRQVSQIIVNLSETLRPNRLLFRAGTRHGLYQRYAANLPNSLEWILPNTFAFLARAPVSVFSTGT